MAGLAALADSAWLRLAPTQSLREARRVQRGALAARAPVGTIYTYLCLSLSIYIYRERDMYVCTYIYIYMYIHTYTYVYV